MLKSFPIFRRNGAHLVEKKDKLERNMDYPPSMTHSKLFDGLNYESKGEDNRRRKSWGTLLGSLHFGGRRAC